ncbi:MAG: F0F1 ATP synthase subunit B [Clostridiales bacterium]|nr:F0F1 ATP synthase subunit B [Clostridiales bacterium]MCD8369459.1 F0F1 ATP synthase subunit B [Clostridiales bacterium]
MNETLDLVGLVPWTFVAQICNLFIQMWLIKKFLLKPVGEILEKRRAMADKEIADAKQAHSEADAVKAEYEQNMADAKAKANEILATAQKTAETRSDAIIKDAESKAAAVKAKAEADIAQERRKAVSEVKTEIGSIAVDIAGKVIEREVSEEDHRKLIEEFIENVGEAS